MIESIEFTNFKALRNATLPLQPFTLLMGPNGSGKSSVLQALQFISSRARNREKGGGNYDRLVSITAKSSRPDINIKLKLHLFGQRFIADLIVNPNRQVTFRVGNQQGTAIQEDHQQGILNWLDRIQVFSLDANKISQPAQVNNLPMPASGEGLSAVLDDLSDNYPERWEMLLKEMGHWLPEYDHIGFDKPSPGEKSIMLRTKRGGHLIPATDLSQGTLIALALLTLAYMPNPPSVVGLEEIDRALHPRLLRDLRDALYRLSYPECSGEKRPPIQVIATSHSPYVMELFRDHPEEVVLAEKEGLEVDLRRLTDISHFNEILGDGPLGEAWYAGVFGGVAVRP